MCVRMSTFLYTHAMEAGGLGWTDFDSVKDVARPVQDRKECKKTCLPVPEAVPTVHGDATCFHACTAERV
jgi:hypothetical protein